MKKYIVDTIALLGYFANALPENADNIFKEAENGSVTLMIPDICIGEFIYTILKQKIVFGNLLQIEFIDYLFDVIEFVDNVQYVSLKLNSWKKFLEIEIPELHDRMIVAMYLQENANAIITNDPKIKEIANTVW